MNRMIFWTAVALCGISLFFNVAFANKPAVEWADFQLSGRDVTMNLKNNGTVEWPRFSVTVKVFDGEKVVSSGMVSQAKGLSASQGRQLRFGLNKPVETGKTYRVQAWLQAGSPKLVTRTWTYSVPPVPAL